MSSEIARTSKESGYKQVLPPWFSTSEYLYFLEQKEIIDQIQRLVEAFREKNKWVTKEDAYKLVALGMLAGIAYTQTTLQIQPD